jgi:hypothetical protein
MLILLRYLCILLLITHVGRAQIMNKNITLRINNQPLGYVLKELQNQADVKFIYDVELLTGISISCEITNQPLESVIRTVLAGTAIDFQITPANSIILFRKKNIPKSLCGVVLDAITRAALPNANIIVTGSHQGTSTDEAGRFELSCPSGDGGIMAVCYIGYDTAEVHFDTHQEPLGLKIFLKPKSIKAPTLTVADYKISQFEFVDPNGNVLLFADEARLFPTPIPGDVYQSLQMLPGTRNVFDRLNGIYVQGGTDAGTESGVVRWYSGFSGGTSLGLYEWV